MRRRGCRRPPGRTLRRRGRRRSLRRSGPPRRRGRRPRTPRAGTGPLRGRTGRAGCTRCRAGGRPPRCPPVRRGLAQRTVELLVEAGEYGVQGVGEDGMAFVQTASHGGALAALPGEEEGQAASRRGTGDQGGVGVPSRSADSARSSARRSSARTAARCSRAAREVASEWATSVSGSSGWSVRWSRRRAACSRRASAVRADSTTGDARGQGVRVGRRGRRRGCGLGRLGACSTMVWTLVPDRPKEEMPAR